MSVIVEMEVAGKEFELGRVFDAVRGVRVEIESMVPVGRRAVPLFWVYTDDRDSFERGINDHPVVDSVTEIEEFDDRVLYAIDWNATFDEFFASIVETDGHVLNAARTSEIWRFEIRFPDHGQLSVFRDSLESAGVAVDILRVYNPTKPDSGPWFGLTETQRAALLLAVETGYYDIPRTCTTVELAERLGVSDQAVTERLRRAIVNLVENSIMVAADEATDWE